MVKVLVSIDERLLSRIDRAARRLGVTRSAYLARLAAREVGADAGPGTEASARRAMATLDALFRELPVPEESTAAVRADRDSR